MSSVSGLVPVHIGQPEPSPIDTPSLRRPRVPDGLDWQKHGLEPRWLGTETSDCAVALETGFTHGGGVEERRRFLTAVHQRGEIALLVSAIGIADETTPRNVFSFFDASVRVGNLFTSVASRRLPAGIRPQLAPDLGAADRDLALRLLNRPEGALWWSLNLVGTKGERGDGSGTVAYEAEGRLQPILVDALGDPVVAVWIASSGDQRWYIIPDGTGWGTILAWLTYHAIPEYVPNALRRARSPHFHDPDLQTADELSARQAMDDLELEYSAEKQRLEQGLREAEARAEPIRYGLLYGTGDRLVRAVTDVLTAAGLHSVDLDEYLGSTKSADLLVSDGPIRRLIEIKSTAGAAPESLVGHIERHLDTWPHLRPDEPVSGGVLIVNHQHKLHPTERTADVYARPEFVAGLSVPVISALQLFHWWRTAEPAAIRAAILGTHVPEPAPPAEPPSSTRRTPSRWQRLTGNRNR